MQKNTHKISVRIISSVLLFAFVFSAVFIVRLPAKADSLEELESRYDAIEDELKENQEKLEDVEEKKEDQKDEVDTLKAEINGLNDQIGILDDRISLLNSDIGSLNADIAGLDAQIEEIDSQITDAELLITDTETRIDETCNKLLNRLAASYMMGDASNLEFLLGASSLAELLTWNQYIDNATEYDNALVEGLEDDIASLEDLKTTLNGKISSLEEVKKEVAVQKAALQEKKSDVQSSADELESKKDSVAAKHSEAIALLNKLDAESDEYARIQTQLADEQAQIDAEINAYLASNGSSQSNPGSIKNDGKLIWPVPYDNCYVSAGFPTYPSGGVHKGIDICVHGGTEGKKIIAAQSGKVIQMGYNHWSMGNYIILDHGNGLFTAYYHASKLYVSSVGQTVKQGDTIALIGRTGNTTGPHLHFEVRVNKNGSVVQVNPLNYVTMP